jgi:hypothetical protein
MALFLFLAGCGPAVLGAHREPPLRESPAAGQICLGLSPVAGIAPDGGRRRGPPDQWRSRTDRQCVPARAGRWCGMALHIHVLFTCDHHERRVAREIAGGRKPRPRRPRPPAVSASAFLTRTDARPNTDGPSPRSFSMTHQPAMRLVSPPPSQTAPNEAIEDVYDGTLRGANAFYSHKLSLLPPLLLLLVVVFEEKKGIGAATISRRATSPSGSRERRSIARWPGRHTARVLVIEKDRGEPDLAHPVTSIMPRSSHALAAPRVLGVRAGDLPRDAAGW